MKQRFSVRIHPAGIAVMIAAVLFADSHTVLAAISALILHEAAHLIAMLLLGMNGCMVEITPFGGMLDAKRFELNPPWKQALAAISGIAASALAAYFSFAHLPDTMLLNSFFRANFSLAFLNALPLWPLDGARVIAALAVYIGLECNVKKLLSWLTIVAGTGLMLLGLYGVWKGIVNLSLLVIGPYLCYAARADMVSGTLRRLEGAKGKLAGNALIPVSVWATAKEGIEERFAVQLSREGLGRYQIVIAIDPASGRIQKFWTEQEMLNHLLENGRN